MTENQTFMKANSKTKSDRLFTYVMIFVGGALLYIAAVLPFLTEHGGIFFYYGDYNVQQVPFYIMAHRAVREGRLFWTPYIDLGSSMGGSMSFYLWGSPFFWLTIPFPESFIPYLMPFLMALKCGTAALTSYAYIRRSVRDSVIAAAGAFLYAFSGFQASAVVFQHFHDVTAFFPLFLICFDEMVQKRRYTGFMFMTALMAVINYYFFFGEVIFIALYYLVRYAPSRKPAECVREIARIVAAGTAGLLMASFFLVQSLGGVSGNTRLDDIISGYGLLAYEDAKTPLAILKSFFVVPDIIAKPTVFGSESIKNSMPAAFLPCFSLAGVIAFVGSRKKNWKSRMIILCGIMAFVPALNAAFSAFNTAYYSRWYFMPMLLMATMTAQVLERGPVRGLWRGALFCAAAAAGFCIFAAFPYRVKGERKWFGICENPKLMKVEIAATAVQFLILILVLFAVRRLKMRRRGRRFLYLGAALVCALITTVGVLYNGDSLIANSGGEKWKKQLLETRPELGNKETFFRVETESTSTNYEMVWGYPTIHCFVSTVHPSIFTFYRQIGLIRTVESTLPTERAGARALLSVQYYLENDLIKPKETIEEKGGLYGYEETGINNGYRILENKNYIPMGFTFDHFITESNYNSIADREARDRLLVRDLILTEEQRVKYSDLMEEDREILQEKMPDTVFDAECAARARSACEQFEFTNEGFTAQAELKADDLVFFSVPYDEGFTARVDGVKTRIEKVDGGLMAVPVPAGRHSIEFTYYPKGLRAAYVISALSALSVIAFSLRRYRINKQARG